MWSPLGGTGFPPPGNQNVPNQGYSPAPVNRFEPRMNYPNYQTSPGGIQSPNNYFRGPPPNQPRTHSPLNLYQQHAYNSPNTYFTPRGMSPMGTGYHSGESMLQQPPPCFTTPPSYSRMPPGGHSSSFHSDSYYSCQETFNSSFVSDGSGIVGPPGGYSSSFSHMTTDSPPNYPTSRVTPSRAARPSTPHRGGGRFGGNSTSRSLSDPWAGLQPIRTPGTGRCLVTTPMAQRHTVLFASQPRVTAAAALVDDEEAGGSDGEVPPLLMPPRKRFSSALCSPTDRVPSGSGIPMPSFE